MSELPHGWVECTLADVGEITTGNTPSTKVQEYYGGKVPFVKPGDLDKAGPLVATEQNLSALGAAQARVLRKGAVLISCIGNLGKTGIAGVSLTTNQQINSVEFHQEFVNDKYGYYVCKLLKPWMEQEASATTVTILNKGKFSQAPFPLAPLPEQKRIADKLDALLARVDACRERLDRVPTFLKRFRQSVLAAATSGKLTEEWREHVKMQLSAKQELDLYLEARSASEKKMPSAPDLSEWNIEPPENWSVCSVHQFAECLDRFRVPIKRDDRKNLEGLYPYYGANGEVSRIDEYIFDGELVLVTEDETFYGREKPIAYRSSGKCWVNNHAHVLKPKSKEAADYLCYALMYYDVTPWLTGTTGRAKLTQQALNALPIAVPSNIEMSEIVRRVEILFACADQIAAKYQAARVQLDRLTPALLAKAFRGELVPQDPNDEPASELLMRIKHPTHKKQK